MRPYVSKVLLPLLGGSVTIAIAALFVLGGRTIVPGVKPTLASDRTLVADAPGNNAKPNPDNSGTAAESESGKEETGTESELDKEGTETESELDKEGGLNSKHSKDKSEEESTQATYLDIQSNPPGARAEVGIQFNGWKIIPGTGRTSCTTPCLVKLDPADVAILPDGVANLVIRLDKTNFAPHIDVVELGKLDRIWALERGKTYARSITLQRNDWLSKDDDSKTDASKPQEKSKTKGLGKVELQQKLK
jgi:hypothetical protein